VEAVTGHPREHTNFTGCLASQTIDQCLAYGDNGVRSPVTDGLFSYGGGHMEKHASLVGLGPLDDAGLATEIRSELGTDIGLGYSQPQLAGGIYTTPADYARFLHKLLGGELLLRGMLGSHAVCTNPRTCAQALNTPVPVPNAESWHDSLGHWVKDDPVVGDGAFSSAGAFGFYPWIDATRTWYGIVAREQAPAAGEDPNESLGQGYRSVECGRLIRKAWITGTAQ
jgi:CubicO group peptidase (beta-lactamase class C family)